MPLGDFALGLVVPAPRPLSGLRFLGTTGLTVLGLAGLLRFLGTRGSAVLGLTKGRVVPCPPSGVVFLMRPALFREGFTSGLNRFLSSDLG